MYINHLTSVAHKLYRNTCALFLKNSRCSNLSPPFKQEGSGSCIQAVLYRWFRLWILGKYHFQTSFLSLQMGTVMIYELSKGLSVFPKNDLFSFWKSGSGTELLAFTSVLYSFGNKVFMNLDNFAGKALAKRGHVNFRSHRPQVGGIAVQTTALCLRCLCKWGGFPDFSYTWAQVTKLGWENGVRVTFSGQFG